MAIVDRVRELVAPIIDAESVELYDIEHNGGRLQIFVDSPNGVDIDVIRRITRAVSRMLDETDPIPGRYTLEVSSPGLERRLRTPDHFRRAVGSDVKLKTLPDADGERRVVGRLTAVDDDGIDIRTDDGVRHVAYSDVSKARTVFEWGPTPKPGQPRANRKKDSSGNTNPDTPQKEAQTS